MTSEGLRIAAAAVLVLSAGAASAQTLRGAPTHGELLVGARAEVHLGWTDEQGQPGRCSDLRATGAILGPPEPVAPGVEARWVTPTDSVVLFECGEQRFQLEAAPRPGGQLPVPKRVEGVAGEPVTIRLEGDKLPRASALEVVSAEGRVASVEEDGEARVITVVPDDSPYPRVLQVGVRDGRGEAEPAWVAVRLRARPRLPLVAEPGSTLSLEVGERSYGPFESDESGSFDVYVDQYPGESLVLARFVDDLGNELDTAIPLPAWTHPSLVGIVAGERGRPGAAPRLYLRAASADGGALPQQPECTADGAPLSLVRLDVGTWMATLSADPQSDPRVSCALGDRASTVIRVPLLDSVPTSVRLRVWPDVVRTDHPTTDVFVTVEDALGRPLPPEGVAVTARTGEVTPTGVESLVWRGTWTGLGVEGQDILTATWMPTESGTVPVAVVLDWDAEVAGALPVRARVFDRAGRPVEGAALTIDTGADAEVVTTDGSGWASARLGLPEEGPVVLTARTPHLVRRRVLHRGLASRPLPDSLAGEAEVRVEPGRVNGIIVRVEPPVLRAGPAASAEITAWVEDPSGAVVSDVGMRVEVEEGEVGPPRQNPQGRWVALWTPGESNIERPVEVTARAGGLRTTTEVRVQPRDISLSVGPWFGAQTNLGELTRPIGGLDLDVRTRAVGESIMFRLGLAGWTWSVSSTGTTVTSVNGVVVPVTGAILFRRDRGRFGAWAGLGATAGAEHLTVKLGERTVTEGLRFVAGPSVLTGVGYRLGRGGGEAVLDVRGTWLGGGSGDVDSVGNIAGVAVGVGYRLVY